MTVVFPSKNREPDSLVIDIKRTSPELSVAVGLPQDTGAPSAGIRTWKSAGQLVIVGNILSTDKGTHNVLKL